MQEPALKTLRLNCSSEECPIARLNGGTHVIDVGTDDPSLGLYEDMPGNYIPNSINYKGPENEIVGTLAYDCPDSNAHNTRTYVGERGRAAMGMLALSGIEVAVI